jgi:GNAT superfamily N-acetyltransferase
MAADWTLRYYRDGDEDQMLDCLIAAFGHWPAIEIDVPPIEHLRWKLGETVNGRRYHIIVESDGRIVACGMVRAIKMKLRDEVVPVALYGDMAVRPEFQNQGIMGAVWSYQDEVGEIFSFSIGVSDNTYVGKEFDKRPRSRPIANRIQVVECETSPARATVAGGIVIEAADVFDERIDALCAAALSEFDFAVARDRAWLNYRYADPKAGRFAIRLAFRGQSLAGYAVLTVARGKGFVADTLVLPGDRDALDALIEDAQAWFAARDIGRVRCWLPTHHPYRDAFESHGFGALRDIGMLNPGRFRDTDLRFVWEDAAASVHYMAGDIDVV